MICLSESKAATHCKIDVYNFSDFEPCLVNSRDKSLIVRHFGS
jgi:hypothetical protein